jgi:hypothetical protein
VLRCETEPQQRRSPSSSAAPSPQLLHCLTPRAVACAGFDGPGARERVRVDVSPPKVARIAVGCATAAVQAAAPSELRRRVLRRYARGERVAIAIEGTVPEWQRCRRRTTRLVGSHTVPAGPSPWRRAHRRITTACLLSLVRASRRRRAQGAARQVLLELPRREEQRAQGRLRTTTEVRPGSFARPRSELPARGRRAPYHS